MSAICNQCIGTSDYRRGPRANVCLNVSPLFCLHGEFGSPCLGFIAFDPVYVCTHYNNSPREGSPVAVLTSEGVRDPRLLQLRLQTFAHQRQEGAMTPWLPAQENTSLSTLTMAGWWWWWYAGAGAVSDRTITQTQTLQWHWEKWYFISSYKIHFQALNWSQSFER